MNDNVTDIMGKAATDSSERKHAAKMQAHREQRANALNIMFGTFVFGACILILVGTVVGCIALVRLAF